MTVTLKIKPLNINYDVSFGGMLSPQARSATLAKFAKEKLADADQKNSAATGGEAPAHDTIVDGVSDVPVESVKPDGTIIFKFHLLGEAIQWIDQMLIEHSPKDAADRYERSHVLYADGTECDPQNPPPAKLYTFLNLQPYSRKIEGTRKPPESKQAPEGVYEVIATMAAQKFGRMASFSFTYIAPHEGAVIDWADTPRRVTKRISPSSRSRDIRQPAIVIKVG